MPPLSLPLHLPSPLSRLPLTHNRDYGQVEKAERREETVAVGVVQLVPPGRQPQDLASSSFLLTQRPKSGLLAGAWPGGRLGARARWQGEWRGAARPARELCSPGL